MLVARHSAERNNPTWNVGFPRALSFPPREIANIPPRISEISPAIPPSLANEDLHVGNLGEKPSTSLSSCLLIASRLARDSAADPLPPPPPKKKIQANSRRCTGGRANATDLITPRTNQQRVCCNRIVSRRAIESSTRSIGPVVHIHVVMLSNLDDSRDKRRDFHKVDKVIYRRPCRYPVPPPRRILVR